MNEHFSKIKMRCTVTCDDNVSVPFKLQQTGSNTFSLKIRSDRHQLDEKKCDLQLAQPIASKKEKEAAPPAAATTTIALGMKRRRRVDDQPAQTTKKAKNATAKKAVAHVYGTPQAVPCTTVAIGDIILCKMRGYCRWPACVTGLDKNAIFVEFFGDHTTQKTTLPNLFSFCDSFHDILYNLRRLRDPLFSKAVKEAEGSLKIPEKNSIFNKM